MTPIDLTGTYVHLDDAGSSREIPVGPDFWAQIHHRADLHSGRLVTQSHFEQNWDAWEMHPEGEEVLIMTRGHGEVVMQGDQGLVPVVMYAGTALVIPRKTWHTMDVMTPVDMIFITPGKNTQHRSRSTDAHSPLET